ncbi:MAG: ATP-grasp ribosomal peptide maturase [Pseudonocardia sp.]
MTVLVLTRSTDATASQVARELERRRVSVLRADVGEFPLEMTMTADTTPRGDWRGVITLSSGESVQLDEIDAIYYRRPTRFRLPADLPADQQRFARAEARRALAGLLLALPVRWLSHPSRVADAELKPLQLQVAAQCGLRVPRTILTSDAAAVRQFAKQLGGPVIYKPLSAPSVPTRDGLKLVYTTQVDPELLDPQDIALTASLFQELVPKHHEVRLTVVDHQFFAAAIHADSPQARLDWRSDYGSLRYETVDVPVNVRRGVSRLLQRLDLPFGALDFAVTPDGEWIFLEINANGQWAWIEDQTGLPVTSAIVDYLEGGRP